jgi:hypothetical protein
VSDEGCAKREVELSLVMLIHSWYLESNWRNDEGVTAAGKGHGVRCNLRFRSTGQFTSAHLRENVEFQLSLKPLPDLRSKLELRRQQTPYVAQKR